MRTRSVKNAPSFLRGHAIWSAAPAPIEQARRHDACSASSQNRNACSNCHKSDLYRPIRTRHDSRCQSEIALLTEVLVAHRLMMRFVYVLGRILSKRAFRTRPKGGCYMNPMVRKGLAVLPC